jgi:putative ABC transport system permease protein
VRQALVVVEIAVALVLFVGAGLMAHSLGQLHRMDPGVDTTNVLTMRLTLPREKYDDVAVERFFDDLVTRVTGTPGVTVGAAASQFPPEVFASTRFRFEGAHGIPDSLPTADLTVVTPGTFRVLGIPMRSGRPLSETDRASTPPVVVVNESFAKRYYPAGSAIGQRIAVGEESRARAWEIVGVVGDTRGRGWPSGRSPKSTYRSHRIVTGGTSCFCSSGPLVRPRRCCQHCGG